MKLKIIVFLGLIINVLLVLYFYIKKFSPPDKDILTLEIQTEAPSAIIQQNELEEKQTDKDRLAIKRTIVIKALIKNLELNASFTNKTIYDDLSDKNKEFFEEITISYFSQVVDKLTKDNYFTVEKQGRIKVYTYINSLNGIMEKTELKTKLGYCNYLAKNENCLNKGNPNKLDLIKVVEKTPVVVRSMEFTSRTDRYVCKNCYEKFFK